MVSFKEVEQYYKDLNCWGLSCSIDLKECDPFLIRSSANIKAFVKDLCDLIKMKRFEETQVVHFGQDEKVEGFSMVQLIETSLISGHFANQTNGAYIDIFSCKIYSPYLAGEFCKNFFKAKEVNVQLSYRK